LAIYSSNCLDWQNDRRRQSGRQVSAVETTEGAMDEYKARQKAERVKMARLRALRLAAQAKAPDEPKMNQKPGGKAKR
jgi:hypothetical protein